MKFENVLLALVARQPATGYDLGRWLATEGVFIRANADQSQIYKTLNRLVDRGLLTFVVERRESAPDGKVYSLTEAGAEQLHGIVESDYTPPARWQEADFTAWYTLLGAIRPDRVVGLIDIELAFRRAQVARFRNRPRRVPAPAGLIDFDPVAMGELFEALHAYNTDAMDRWLIWLEQTRDVWAARFPNARGSTGDVAGNRLVAQS